MKRRKGLSKHLRKKRAKKLLNALCEKELLCGELNENDISGETHTCLSSLFIGDSFFYEGKNYTVADAEVAGYIAVIDESGEQEWLPSNLAI